MNVAGDPVAKWGSYGSGPGQFIRPIAIALDARGQVYVLDSELRRVQKFNNDGTAYYGSFGGVGTRDGEFTAIGGGPRDIVIDAAGDAYISDTSAYRIHKWRLNSDATGQLTGTNFAGWLGGCESGPNCDDVHDKSKGFTCSQSTCSPPIRGSMFGQFQNPFGLAIDSAGNLLVADFDNNRVQKFGPNGDFRAEFGTLGTGPDQFRGPIDVAAFRFFFVKTLKRPYLLEDIPYPKVPRRLPTILTVDRSHPTD